MHGAQRRRRGVRGIPGLIFEVANYSTTDTAVLTSLVDHSGLGNNFAVDSTDSKKPVGLKRNMGFGGLSCARFIESAARYAQAAAALRSFHKDDFTVFLKFRLWQFNGVGAIFTTWAGASSNENAITIEWSNEFFQFYILSTAGGGSIHYNKTTTNHLIHTGDLVEICWRRSGSSSKLRIRRHGRFPGDPDDIIVINESITGTPSSSAATALPTIGAYTGKTTGISSMDLRRAAAWSRSLTDEEMLRVFAQSAAEDRFAWRTPVANRPLIVGTDIGSNASGGADDVHPNDLGQAKKGHNQSDGITYVATRLGKTTGTVRVACTGDSREVGLNASGNATTGRAVALNDLSGAPFTVVEVGPETSSGGHHMAVSGAVWRTLPGSTGLSRREPGAKTLDNNYGSGRAYNDTDIMEIWCGTNYLNRLIAEMLKYDQPEEILREMEAVRSDVQTYASHDVGFIVQDEPSTHATVTGPLRGYLDADVHDKHVLCELAERQGMITALCNLKDYTYNP